MGLMEGEVGGGRQVGRARWEMGGGKDWAEMENSGVGQKILRMRLAGWDQETQERLYILERSQKKATHKSSE